MSLRSEAVRLGLRWMIKRRNCLELSVQQHRQFASAAERLVPDPPPTTETRRLDTEGVRGELVTTPFSQPHRHVLFLHGGGFIIGSPSLYRHVTWRIADSARARVLAADSGWRLNTLSRPRSTTRSRLINGFWRAAPSRGGLPLWAIRPAAVSSSR